MPVACGQGMQVMCCMTSEFLYDDFISERNKEQLCFGTKLEKVSWFETKSRKSGRDFR